MDKVPDTGQPVRLNVKMACAPRAKTCTDLLAGTPGLKSVTQTFPDEKDEELSRLYVVEVEPTAVDQVLKKLEESPAVEYAERAGRRRLIR